jgi:hypothetical protein
MTVPEPLLTPTRLSARFYRVAAVAAAVAAFATAAVANPLASLGFAVAVVALEGCAELRRATSSAPVGQVAGSKTTRREFGVEVRVDRDDRR